MKMHIYVALGISIGILAGVLILIDALAAGHYNVDTGAGSWLNWQAWPGFVSWALYFAIGGKPVGMGKVMAANTAGIIVAGIIVVLAGLFGGSTIALAIAVVIGAFILCVEAFWAPLSFIPGAFCGCACTFGMGGNFSAIGLMVATAISMYLGAILAYLSDLWGQKMAKSEDEG